MVARQDEYCVLVPVKPPGSGKSRLQGVSADERVRLATAFATDTVAACLATASVATVLVVTDDEDVARTAEALGAATCSDGGVGLNPALRRAAGVAHERWPGLVPVALLADLPALRPDDLAAALREVALRAATAASYVIDAEGTGTTLYTAASGIFDPLFGADSAARHQAAGAVPVSGDLATLRRDVDDLAGLEAAVALGVGTATRALVRHGALRLRG